MSREEGSYRVTVLFISCMPSTNPSPLAAVDLRTDISDFLRVKAGVLGYVFIGHNVPDPTNEVVPLDVEA